MFGVFHRSLAGQVVSQQRRCLANARSPGSKPKGKAPASTAKGTPVSEPVPEDPLAQPTPAPAPIPAAASIPSTLNLPSLDFDPPTSEQTAERTGARSSKDTLSASEERRKAMRRLGMAAFGLAVLANVGYMGREWSEDEVKSRKLSTEDSAASRVDRTLKRYSQIFSYFSEPVWEELLPPAFPPPHGKPMTLLVSLDDLLVTSTWDRQHGWRTAKRPGVDYFLAYISQFYEIVIFTTQNNYTAMPILDKLDRYNFFITHRLCREATRSVNGRIVKDLSYLNRDLSKVIVLDTDPDHVSTHPENAIILPKWKGETGDKGLISLIPFLESIGIYKPADVRPILDAYRGKDIPLEYAKKEAEQKAQHLAKYSTAPSSGASSWLGPAFGLSAPPSAVPLTYLETKRKEAQRNYADEKAYIERNKDYLEKLLKQEQDRMAADVPGNLWEALDQMQGKPKAAVPTDSPASAQTAEAKP